jgi:hypothetical protein
MQDRGYEGWIGHNIRCSAKHHQWSRGNSRMLNLPNNTVPNLENTDEMPTNIFGERLNLSKLHPTMVVIPHATLDG